MNDGKASPPIPIAVLVTVIVVIVLLGVLSNETAMADNGQDTTAPVADAGPDIKVELGSTVVLDGSRSTDDVGVVGWNWSFEHGGGTVTLSGVTPSFRFEEKGNHTLTLNVTDAGGNWATDTLVVEVLTAPGRVTEFLALPRDGYVELTWMPPEDDGGTEILTYLIYKGRTEDDLEFAGIPWWMPNSAVDKGVDNGVTYYYGIKAMNDVGISTMSHIASATPMAVPDVPGAFQAEYRDGAVLLSWEPPVESVGRFQVTGYTLHRGTSPNELGDVIELGVVLSYTDTGIEVGGVYYYAIGANCEYGHSNLSQLQVVETDGKEDKGLELPLLLLIVAVLAVVVAFAGWRVARLRRAQRGG